MSGSDSAEKKGGVPSWQTAAPKKEEEKPKSEPESREKVLERAKKFLEEAEVKDATTDKKIAFLESKGLQGEEIQSLLGISRNEEASNSTSTSPSPPQPSQTPSTTQTTYRPSTTSQPPIITYPEFLTTPTHPTPLITKPRLLSTLYAFTFMTALLYGTNTYLVTPMVESLTDARLDLASTTSENLQKLLAKFESMVSVVPEKKIERTDEDDEDDDPTELFHRDIGIQTSPPRSRSSSPSPSPLTAQVSRLSVLQTHLSELRDDSTSEGQHTSDLENTMGILREYLDGMAYVAPSYNFGYGGTSGVGGKKEEDDEITRVKQGIRGVKGVLLSARSFPGGVRAR